ncbi:hypothetical protein N658DRAFT_511580 [Parathielavia hyrcaniae]|uniref:Uncharacterized protein n=1 Tax=Parathielavia hyrcaniae TaxID=113614 RepID=A0AAN6PQB6_9PEZI|nr:hypothetical protein N658DRAFT_511580 [Parathielavia hyrcaniae]
MAHLARLPLYGLLVVQVLFAGVAQSAEFHELFTAYSRADKGGCQNHLGTGGLFDKWHQEMFDMVAAAVKGFHEYDITPPVQMAARNFLGVPRDPRAIPGTLKPPRGKIYGTYNNAPLPWLFCDSSFLTPKDTTSQAQDSMCNLLTTPNLIPVLIGNEYAKRLTNGKKPFWSEDMCTYVFEPPEHGDNYCAAVEGDKGLAVTLDTLHNDLIPNHPPDPQDEAEPPSEEEDEEVSDGQEATETRDLSGQPRGHRNTGAETRIVTRVYAGPLRRYARYSALRDAMYGPEYDRIKVVWDLEIRWADFPVLPPRLPPEDPHGVVPSPWLAPGFEKAQKARASLWYSDYQTTSSEVQQSHALAPEDGQQFIPQAEGDIVTLVGPWDRQKQFTLRQDGSLPLSPMGLPVNDPEASDNTPSGWMLDVGGIPLAMSWAPLARQDIQVLAVATVPFSDQTAGSGDKANTDEAAQSTGCIQLWEFVPERRPGQLAAPSTRPPRLLGASCFDWGRPKRLEFCPIPQDHLGLYGILAVLCGDGKARVIEVWKANEADGPFYEWIDSPVVTLGLTEDYNVSVWVIRRRKQLVDMIFDIVAETHLNFEMQRRFAHDVEKHCLGSVIMFDPSDHRLVEFQQPSV